MAKSLDRAQPDLEFLAPQTQEWLLTGLRFLLPSWLRWRCKIKNIQIQNLERLTKITTEFKLGKVRYILAFRHPTIDDQFTLFHLLGMALPESCSEIKKFSAYYVYDRGIPLWAGEIVSYLYPRTGGIPIHRGKLDRQGLQTIRKFLLTGEYPIAISPEGGTNGHSEMVSALEPGVAQIGFWGCEDLQKAGRTEQVVILPVGIQYQYLDAWPAIDRLLLDLENECGMPKLALLPQDRYARLYGLATHLMEFVDKHYQRFYGEDLASKASNLISGTNSGANSGQNLEQNLQNTESQDLKDRLQKLLDQILHVAESNLGIKPNGTLVDRSRRLEQAGWDRIFRADVQTFSVLERGFADQIAKEANMSHWHLRIAESLTAITGNYVKSHPSSTRFAEMLLLIWRSLSRVKNQPFGKSPDLGDRSCSISIGEPILVSDYFGEYQSSRSAAKACVANITAKLQLALEQLIQPSDLET